MKYKDNQKPLKEFLENIINLNGLYFESHSVCKCELSIQLRLRYNGKRKLFVLCGDKSPLEDDSDEDISNENKEEDNTDVGKETEAMEKIISVEGMMCEHCEATVVKALEKLDGVESAEASHEKNQAVVRLSHDVDDDALKKAIEDRDYKVTGIR